MCWLTGRGPDCRGGVPGFESSKSVTVYKTLKTSRLTVCMLKKMGTSTRGNTKIVELKKKIFSVLPIVEVMFGYDVLL